MKKLKLIPGLILLALCIAVLGVGIYAAAPASNTITGTVTVNAANAEVKVSVYQDSVIPANLQDSNTTRTHSDLDLGDFTFDASSANSKFDVPLKEIIIKVENHSLTQDLGMYFWKSTAEGGNSTLDVIASGDEQGCVQVSDVLYGHYKYDSNDLVPVQDVIDVEYEFYKHLPKATDENSNGVWDEGTDTAGVEYIRMYIRLDKLVEDDVDIDLEITLNIEKYVSNYTNSKTGFVKLAVGENLPGRNEYANGVTQITIPYGVDGISGHENQERSHMYNTAVETIALPSTMTSMYSFAFAKCTSLTSVFIPYGFTEFVDGSDAAFADCTSLTTIYIPSSVTFLYSTFIGCSSLARIDGMAGVTRLGYSAFSGTAWDNAQTNNSVVYLNNWCLGYKGTMPASTTISIKVGTAGIKDGAFYDETNLVGVTIPSSITIISKSAFSGCTGLTSIEFPSGTQRIEDYAFSGCTGLASNISFTTSLVYIGERAFAETLFTTIYYSGTKEAFRALRFNQYCYTDSAITVAMCSDGDAFGYCCFVAGTQVTMADGTYKNIEDVVLGDKVLSIDEDTGTLIETEVVRIFIKRDSKQMARVYFDDESMVDMTDYHPLFTDEGWHSITNLHDYDTLVVGDRVRTQLGWKTITAIDLYEYENFELTYDIGVFIENYTNFHNYFANNTLAHNK